MPMTPIIALKIIIVSSLGNAKKRFVYIRMVYIPIPNPAIASDAMNAIHIYEKKYLCFDLMIFVRTIFFFSGIQKNVEKCIS
tara:strand:- start:1770 stop:2015 length:246 start_codon:yes stop_codon:yes gene_type:complete